MLPGERHAGRAGQSSKFAISRNQGCRVGALGVRSMMTTTSKPDLAGLAASIVRCFPSLNLLEQRLSLDLYRLLAEGQPVQRMELAKRLGASVEAVNRTLESWPGVFSDAQERITGYWGLSIASAYGSP